MGTCYAADDATDAVRERERKLVFSFPFFFCSVHLVFFVYRGRERRDFVRGAISVDDSAVGNGRFRPISLSKPIE